MKFILLFSFLTLWGKAQRPNIVWITIEDTSPDFTGCYGNKQVKTPNIDALAEEGVRFTNAYSTNTICSPSRHTIISGVRTAQDGCGHHRSTHKVPAYIKGFASYLKGAGYFTTNNSKTDYNLEDVNSFIQQNWSLQGGKADFTKRKDPSQPFFSIFNLDETHQSRTMVNGQDWYEKNILPLLSQEEIIQPDNLQVPPFYQDDADNRKNIARLYNCIQAMDKKVGAIIKMIKDAGEWDNTIVFFYSDHGQGMPRFKAHSSRLGTQVPMVIRLPEKYRSLLNIALGGIYNDLVTFEDLAPTMISIATGRPKPSYMKGRIFMGDKTEATDNVFWGCRDNTDEVIDMGRTVIKGDWVYTRFYYPHLPVLQHYNYFDGSDIVKQMRSDLAGNELDSLQASIFQSRSAEYLFNRRTDKWETKNLAGDKSYKKILKEMRGLNQQKMQCYQDLHFLPQTVQAQIDASDTLLTWKTSNYHFEKYQKVAEMVGMGPVFLRKQLALLADKDSVVRYWAAIGLRNQEASALNKAVLHNAFSTEVSDFVKVELAEVLYAKFNDQKALQWIVDLVNRSANQYLVRQAAIKLANQEALPAIIIEQVRAIRSRKKVNEREDMAYPIQAALNTVVKAEQE